MSTVNMYVLLNKPKRVICFGTTRLFISIRLCEILR